MIMSFILCLLLQKFWFWSTLELHKWANKSATKNANSKNNLCCNGITFSSQKHSWIPIVKTVGLNYFPMKIEVSDPHPGQVKGSTKMLQFLFSQTLENDLRLLLCVWFGESFIGFAISTDEIVMAEISEQLTLRQFPKSRTLK